MWQPPRGFWLVMWMLLLSSVAVRLYRLDAPLVDGFWDKQVAMANKGRNMAGPPFQLHGSSYDFLQEPDGSRSIVIEEIPLHHGLIAVGYTWFGEQDWFARLINVLASLAVLGGFLVLFRREIGAVPAMLATVVLAFCPLLVYYGRAVVPDVGMLACMLWAAAVARRYLDDPRSRWLVACGLLGLAAACFKYFGLMVALPLAELAARREGWRGWLRPHFYVPLLIMTVPIVAYVWFVFATQNNPSRNQIYFLFQRPSMLFESLMWGRLVDAFYKGGGPVTCVLMIAGIIAAARGSLSIRMRSVIVWTATGLLFYFLLAPKAVGHEYYQLILLPAIALWSAIGLCVICRLEFRPPNNLSESSPARRWTWQFAMGVLVLTAVVHSPWLASSRYYRRDLGYVVAAGRLAELCSTDGRIVVGPRTPQPIVHYAQREGWLWQHDLGPDWQATLTQYQRHGAEYVLVYLKPDLSVWQLDFCQTLVAHLPVVEHHEGPWEHGGRRAEFYVLQIPADFDGPARKPPGLSPWAAPAPGIDRGNRTKFDHTLRWPVDSLRTSLSMADRSRSSEIDQMDRIAEELHDRL